MKIKKINIRNLYGITEYEADGTSVELSGKNGTGKTSVIDAIRYALTNKSDRRYIIKKGAEEGEILIETDNGIRIDRKPRIAQADYKSVKKDGHEVQRPSCGIFFLLCSYHRLNLWRSPKKSRTRLSWT